MAQPGILSSQIPKSEDWIPREIADIKREMRELGPSIMHSFQSVVDELVAHQATLDATVAAIAALLTSSGTTSVVGSLTVPGELTTLDTDGSVLLKSGTQQYGDRGLSVYRDDGSPAFVVKSVFAGNPQSSQLYDRAGKTIGGDVIVGTSGFDAPHVPIPFTPTDVTISTYARTTSSATFVPLFEHYGYHQNPAMRLKVKAWCSDGTTTADIQVWDVIGGAYVTEFFGPTSKISVPLATTVPTVFTTAASIYLPGAMSDPMQLEIHVKRTAGAGSVSVAVLRSIGYYV